MANIDQKEYGRRFRKALSVPFALNQVCCNSIQDFTKSYAAAVGCNEKCVLFPLLSCVSGCMGSNSYLELSQEWKEVPIIWTLTITPMTLYRINVAEHIRNQLIAVQSELFSAQSEDCEEPPFSKFLIDLVSQEELRQMLMNNSGQALGIYSSTSSLEQLMGNPESEEVMFRLHTGSSWFTDNTRRHKKLLNKTHVNFAVVASPTTVCNSLEKSPCFSQIYRDCFLTICAEENHIKFSQLKESTAAEHMRKVFKEVINLHLKVPIVYKLSEEAATKFADIHDAITNKAKQIARKNPEKVFHPAISYLARLTCVLHVLENILDSLAMKMPIDNLTWNCEIGPDIVWQARQLLGYVIEQKYSLAQPTTVTSSPAKSVESVTVVDGNPTKSFQGRTPAPSAATGRGFLSPGNYVQQRGTPTRTMSGTPTRTMSGTPTRTMSGTPPFVRPLNQHPATATNTRTRGSGSFGRLLANGMAHPVLQNEPLIVGIASAGVSVPVQEAFGSAHQ